MVPVGSMDHVHIIYFIRTLLCPGLLNAFSARSEAVRGIVHKVKITDDLGWGVSVRWVSSERISIGKLQDFCNHLRRGALYEEFDPQVAKTVIDKFVPPIK